MALILYPNGEASFIKLATHPEYFDDSGRLNLIFIQATLDAEDIGTIFIDEPETVLTIGEGAMEGHYTMFLFDNEATFKYLPTNQFMTDVALQVGMIPQGAVISGTVICLETDELGITD
jgi:hypothetical protein